MIFFQKKIMNFNLYKHGISTFSVTPSGDAGLAINTNFTNIADYLDGVALLVGSTFTGTVAAPSFVGPLTGNCSGTASTITGSITQSQVTGLTTALGSYLPLAGGTMTGSLNMGSQTLINTGNVGVGTASPATLLDVQGVTTLRNLGNTLTTTVTGNLIAAGGTAANVPMQLATKGTGGLILNDVTGASFNLGTGAVDLQVTRAGSSTAQAAGSTILGGNTNCVVSGASNGAIVGSSTCTISAGTNNVHIAAAQVTQTVPSFCLTTGKSAIPRTSYAITQSANDTFTTPAQTSVVPLVGTTTDGVTWVALKAGTITSIANDNLVTVPSNTSMMFSAHIIARSFTNNNLITAFKLEGCVDNNGTTTSLVGTPTITKWDEVTPTGYAVQAVASSGVLSIQAKGIASNTVRWSARLTTVEVSGLTAGGS
jgi:hypothetical protein